eukprot:TRINITY_DN5203_c0_g1_i4.p1 TRINITY_DN5203_c0_g1~~TRINITY_DN5203_c0_g1_i4.p1  ORF type:complete len:392 (+),score=70.91 TRINITY_DN5203_c0_g1_i4:100-1275(+)
MCIRDRCCDMESLSTSMQDLHAPLMSPVHPQSATFQSRPTVELEAVCHLIEFHSGTTEKIRSQDHLQDVLQDGDREHLRWLSFRGDVQFEIISHLRDRFGIPSALLACALQRDLLEFPGGAICVDMPGERQLVCVSFGAPLPHEPHRLDTDIAKVWYHLILVENTLISFSKSHGLTLGMFGSQKKMDKFNNEYNNILVEQVASRVRERAASAAGSAELQFLRWEVLSTVFDVVQQQLFCPAAHIQQHLIDGIWAKAADPGSVAAHSSELLDDIYTLIQRSTIMVSLGQAFEEMLVGVCEEEFDRFSITGESARSLFRALVKAVQLSARSTSKEFATQSSMVLGVEQAWAKRQELMHTRVNSKGEGEGEGASEGLELRYSVGAPANLWVQRC